MKIVCQDCGQIVESNATHTIHDCGVYRNKVIARYVTEQTAKLAQAQE